MHSACLKLTEIEWEEIQFISFLNFHTNSIRLVTIWLYRKLRVSNEVLKSYSNYVCNKVISVWKDICF